jgi:hypothetical protein
MEGLPSIAWGVDTETYIPYSVWIHVESFPAFSHCFHVSKYESVWLCYDSKEGYSSDYIHFIITIKLSYPCLSWESGNHHH